MADSTHPLVSPFPASGPISAKAASASWPFFKPTFLDLFFISTIVWLFAITPMGWNSLLADGDTGWHIRAGEYMWEHKSFIHEDFFSFSNAGKLWYAWEWGAELLFAGLNAVGGLKGVVLFSGVVITLSMTVLFRHMVWRGTSPLVAMAVSLIATGAASNHYLARPHVITFLFLTASLFLIDRDRSDQTRWIWALIPLTLVWANMHGGFFSLIACLGLISAGHLVAGEWMKGFRYSLLGFLCLVVTVVNPYGIGLHKHMVEYLQSNWIKNVVEEFQSPSFRGENVFQFEALMFLGIVIVGLFIQRKKYSEAFLILFWAHNALVSARHISVFVLVACPFIAAEISKWLNTLCQDQPKKSIPRILKAMSDDLYPACIRVSIWMAIPILGLALWSDPKRWPQDFPKERFPVAMVNKHAATLVKSTTLAPDEWGDYLIYRFYPKVRVFFDGRSDFYGPILGKDYISLMQAEYNWEQVLEKHKFTTAFIPPAWPLASILKRHPGWQLVEDDGDAILFIKR